MGGVAGLRVCIITFCHYVLVMSTGRINSPESIATASRLFRAFSHSWDEIERAAERREDGVFVIRRKTLVAREKNLR